MTLAPSDYAFHLSNSLSPQNRLMKYIFTHFFFYVLLGVSMAHAQTPITGKTNLQISDACIVPEQSSLTILAHSPNFGFIITDDPSNTWYYAWGQNRAPASHFRLLCDTWPVIVVRDGFLWEYQPVGPFPWAAPLYGILPLGGGDSPGVLDVASGAEDDSLIFIATKDGLLKSMARGNSWEMIDSASTSMVHVHAAGDHIVYTDRAVSLDGGLNWRGGRFQNPQIELEDAKIISLESEPDRVWTCNQAGLYRWDEHGKRGALFSNLDTHGPCRDLLIHHMHEHIMWMGTENGLWVTIDGGETWRKRTKDVGNLPVTWVEFVSNEQEWPDLLVGTWGKGVEILPSAKTALDLLTTSEQDEVPEASVLYGSYPNPFRSRVTIQFVVSEPSNVQIDVLDIIGRQVDVVVNQSYGPGRHQVQWENVSHSSGVYFTRMRVNNRDVGVLKMIHTQ